MLNINYPKPNFQVKIEGGKEFVFDQIRKKWLLLTPEEWVRQNFVQYLIQVKGFPSTLIALEKSIRLGELTKRFDILIYDTNHQPWMMIECKAPTVQLNSAVFHQLLRYHITVPAGLLVITNGDHTYGWEKKEKELLLLNEIPDWII